MKIYAENHWNKQSTWPIYTSHTLSMVEGRDIYDLLYPYTKQSLINLKGKMYKCRFDNSNTQKLMERMSENEKGEFGFDVGSMDWRDYITNVHIPGLRRHVMKGRRMCG